jgi:hypothetical protein
MEGEDERQCGPGDAHYNARYVGEKRLWSISGNIRTKGATMDTNLLTLVVALLGLVGAGIWVYKKGT